MRPAGDYWESMDSRSVPPLAHQTLHVWRIALDRPESEIARLADCLSDDERGRAARFLREVHRRRFTAAHAALRKILGGYLKVAPRQVALATRSGGKPELIAATHAPPLRFNLSHSSELALLAVALGREVGVDVERARDGIDMENIVSRFFAPGEQATWRRLTADERLAGFFRCWTRKEAYMKAHGVGLSLGLDRFEVSLAPGEPARLLRSELPDGSTSRWRMFDLTPGEGYFAACVVEAPADAPPALFEWAA